LNATTCVCVRHQTRPRFDVSVLYRKNVFSGNYDHKFLLRTTLKSVIVSLMGW